MYYRLELDENDNDITLTNKVTGIPQEVTTLDLQQNLLGTLFEGNQLIDLFTQLNGLSKIRELDLSINFLFRLKEETKALATLFALLSRKLIVLDISGNFLSQLGDVEVETAFAELPRSIKALNLAFNSLNELKAETLEKIFNNLPTSLINLDLNSNQLGNKTADELAKILANLPSTLRYLDISSNQLGSKTADELAKVLASLPSTLRYLDISSNQLSNKTAGELAKILASIPPTTVNLGSDLKVILQKLNNDKQCVESVTFLAIEDEDEETLGLLKTVFPNLKELRLIDESGNILVESPVKSSNRLRTYGSNPEVPSLVTQTFFFIAQNKESPKLKDYKTILPETLSEHIGQEINDNLRDSNSNEQNDLDEPDDLDESDDSSIKNNNAPRNSNR
ncbi:hypothetical protein ACQUW5_03880 [Legionella sp. CNM-1927-20]|uniref:hypothetical protein n=1 Tax=Legionella sp. CNM-1927-20 TaxID=3422221 RepID=UPI00403B1FED